MLRTAKLCQLGALALALSLAGTAWAGQKHLGYMHTMEDLRLARALLLRPDMPQAGSDSQDEVSLTVSNIDAAMAEINKEIGPGNSKPHELPRIDSRMPGPERLSTSLKLLEKAREDCSTEKDNGGANGLRARVFNFLDQAHTRITVAIETKNFDYNARNMPTRND